MKRIMMLLVVSGLANAASAAVTADDLRGGWEVYVNGVEHIYEFVISGDRIRGIYCTVCNNAETLAFLDGRLGSDGMSFVVTHVDDDGATTYKERARAVLMGNNLRVTGQRTDGSHAFKWMMQRDPRGPAPGRFKDPQTGTYLFVTKLPPGPVPGNKDLPAAPPTFPKRPPPGPWEPLSMKRIEGVWLAGLGVDKQIFVFRRVGNELRGMVCGRCDNPYTMATFDDFKIQGDTVTFTDHHEDWGIGALPYQYAMTAHIVDNELRVHGQHSNLPQTFDMTLLGPVGFAATATNTIPREDTK